MRHRRSSEEDSAHIENPGSVAAVARLQDKKTEDPENPEEVDEKSLPEVGKFITIGDNVSGRKLLERYAET